MSNGAGLMHGHRATRLRDRLRDLCSLHPLLTSWPRQLDGVPITFSEDGVVTYDLEGHRLILGDPGEGKGTSVFMPLLLHDIRGRNGRSAGMIVIDPKDGDLVKKSRPVRSLFSGPVYTLDPFGLTGGVTDSCNPLDTLNPAHVDFFARCTGLARAIVGEPAQDGRDGVVWQVRARELLAGIIGHLASDPSEEKTLMRIRKFIRSGADEFIQLCQAMVANRNAPSFVADTGYELQRLLEKAPKEWQGYISVISQNTAFADDPRLARVLSRSSFNWAHVRQNSATVYVTVPDADLAMAAPWLRLMVETGVQAARTAHLPARQQRAACDVHLLIDEAKALGPWMFIEDALRALRSERISLHLAYQNVAQIKSVWREGYTRITAVKLIQFLGSNDVETCEWIAKLAGETTVLDKSASKSTSDGTSWGTNESEGENESEQTSWSQQSGQTIGLGRSTGQSRATSRNKQSGRSTTEGWSTAVSIGAGWSVTNTNSTSMTFSGGPGGGVSNTSGDGTASGISGNQSETTGRSGGTTLSDSESTGETETTTTGDSVNISVQKGEGTGGGRGKGTQRQRGKNEGGSRQTSTGTTYTEKRRLMTVQEVRALSRQHAVVFVERQQGVLVRKMHYHRNPALMLRIVEGKLA